jgi:S1-C subfamily serine protease
MTRLATPWTATVAGLLMVALSAGCGATTPPPAPLLVTVAAGGLTGDVATAVPVGPERVLAVAHVLAGARSVHVGTRPARVLRTDPRLDLAVLEVRGLDAPRAHFAQASGVAELHVLRDGRPRTIAVQVRRRATVALKDRRTHRTDVRPALEIATPVLPGDSGAPVTDDRGRVVGLVFARGLGATGTAWAVELAELPAYVGAF